MKIFKHEFTSDSIREPLFVVMSNDGQFWASITDLINLSQYSDLDQLFVAEETNNAIVPFESLFERNTNLLLPPNYSETTRFVTLEYFFEKCRTLSSDIRKRLLDLWNLEIKPFVQRTIKEENKRAERTVARNYNKDPNAYGYLYLATTPSYEIDGFYRYGYTTQLNNELKKLNKLRINDHFSMVWMKSCPLVKRNMDLMVNTLDKYHAHKEKQFFRFNFGRDEVLELVDSIF